MSVSRRSITAAALVTLFGGLFALALWFTASSGTGASIPSTGSITKVEYSRQKALPDFDQSVHSVSDRPMLRSLEIALRDSGWAPGRERWNDDGCEGGTRTMLAIRYSDGLVREYDGYNCGDGSPAVVREVDAVVDQW